MAPRTTPTNPSASSSSREAGTCIWEMGIGMGIQTRSRVFFYDRSCDIHHPLRHEQQTNKQGQRTGLTEVGPLWAQRTAPPHQRGRRSTSPRRRRDAWLTPPAAAGQAAPRPRRRRKRGHGCNRWSSPQLRRRARAPNCSAAALWYRRVSRDGSQGDVRTVGQSHAAVGTEALRAVAAEYQRQRARVGQGLAARRSRRGKQCDRHETSCSCGAG